MMTALSGFAGFVVGASLGSYVPLALLYLAMPFVAQKFDLRLVRDFLLRAAGVLVVLLVVLVTLGVLFTALDLKSNAPFNAVAAPGMAFGVLGGVIAFVVGVRRALHRKASPAADSRLAG